MVHTSKLENTHTLKKNGYLRTSDNNLQIGVGTSEGVELYVLCAKSDFFA